ncbi:PQQ-dependent dehydrogenase, methanol/ethanol family [Aquamicrobium soli]|uniref:PQQ-dependent dehydrogenase, methanol/ethanol family n=1 Tax=Aquamicrobium soli TaxID=1811518 RepID=A0ABV7KG27_9HYPH
MAFLRRSVLSIVSGLALAGLAHTASLADVSSDALLKAQDNGGEWLMYGRNYLNQRYSTLDKITKENVSQLKPVFGYSTGGKFAGLEATPLFHNGTLYFTADYARVFALDARTGTVKWYWEPEYEDGLEAVLCCGPVNRGLAISGDKVYVGTLDARLVALNIKDGSVAWEKKIDEWQNAYASTGAPLVVKGKVIVGIAGAEYGVRGYVRAYDAETGKELWTRHTIPGPGEPEHDTWPGETWKTGGASTWQTGAYDPETNLLYWGTGNPGPWNSDLRKGDNKWSCSLLAIDVDTGEIKWGYQYTPNDAWDYDGNNAPVLMDVTIDGKPRKVAVQANRNGFLYVLDRVTGEFIYASATVEGINWTSGLDPKTGRPTVNEDKRPKSGGDKVEPIIPGLEGGTNWFPIASNPDKGIVYLNTNDWVMSLKAWKPEDVVYKAGSLYMGVDYQMYRHKDKTGYLKAFDVANKKWLWELPSALPMFAGVLATKNGLLFTGDQLGNFMAVDADSGKQLWRFQTGSGINASPITYELDGKQYVAILSGLGGDPSFYFSGPKGGMLWVFAVDGEVKDTTSFNPQLIETALPVYGKQ